MRKVWLEWEYEVFKLSVRLMTEILDRGYAEDKIDVVETHTVLTELG